MTLTAFAAPQIFDGHRWHTDCALLVEGAIVQAILPRTDLPEVSRTVDWDEGMIVPGFVDIQTNGGGGILLNDDPTPEGLERICAAQFAYGTTALLPTLITDTPEITAATLDAGREAQRRQMPGFAGLHLEGPHLSVARKGAHKPDYIRPMTDADFARLADARAELATLLTTIAPETVPPARIRDLVQAGLIVSLGHSDTDAATAKAAFAAGASMVTHLFNAMSPLGNREPGLVGAALEAGVWAGLIADGIHVHPTTIALALRAHQGPGRILLVSDAMAQIGTDITQFLLDGATVIRRDGALRLEDGTLAGADLTMIDAVKFMHRALEMPLNEALRMAALYPAQAIGRSDTLGHLQPGADASLLHLDAGLDVGSVWIGGREIQ
ncbi:MAG TPA: N-acetylglucosamine-6-phosphate deacetylase [Pelagibacterium sp.]|uniref:N-acetylglucosamine-6-phosphate deacetylase n=1 Tax=Pelagibacterium sp. TaxID=1967288 RepID=UPI002C4F1CBC|nr:N-acetylglucosamine-6-phosphate deacetylase [Pelagibacterium sp.]HWJ87112.1 N-acetylglucosamine-6-phosphate deacetylase [Pelagibacterium sp.]